jgi:hypothetical protein
MKKKVTLIEKYRFKPDLSGLDTDELNIDLRVLLRLCNRIYFEPLTNKLKSGDIPLENVALIHRLTAELTSRYLLTGF